MGIATALSLALLAAWPSADAVLTPPEVPVAHPRAAKLRVFIDPGHGAPDNVGNVGVTCQLEEDFTLQTAEALALSLRATGHFEVKLARKGRARRTHPERLRDAEAWRADVLLSLHSDARGLAVWWSPPEAAGQLCLRQDATPGFSVLWSGEAGARLKARRESLAVHLARQMIATGFTPFDGLDYWGLFDPHPAQAAVFSDRRRLYLLRRPKMASVIIETHHALDFAEAQRWREPATLEAFSAAVARALLDWSADPVASPLATTRI